VEVAAERKTIVANHEVLMNQQLRMPDFIIVGAQKCGTTTLHYALSKHPNVFMSSPKELDYFQDDRNYNRGPGWYASFFSACANNQIAGESSPEYFHFDYVAQRIKALLPKIKIIICLRNPVDRAYSAYWHAVRTSGETMSFERAVSLEPMRIKNNKDAQKKYSYLYRSDYIQQIKPYYQNFAKENIFITISEEYFKKPEVELTQVAEFLNLPANSTFIGLAKNTRENEAKIPRFIRLQKYYILLKEHYPSIQKKINYLKKRYPKYSKIVEIIYRKKGTYPPLTSEIRKHLVLNFAKSVSELEEYIGRDLTIWKE
jgi:hypothetical protein